MFKILAGLTTETNLQELASRFILVHKRGHAGLMCLDHVFVSPPAIQVADLKTVRDQLYSFYVYAFSLREFGLTPKPCSNEAIRRILRISPSGDHVFSLQAGTWLRRLVFESRVKISIIRHDEHGTLWVYEAELCNFIKSSVLTRLKERVLRENEMCRLTQAFSPCVSFATSGICHRDPCSQAHLVPVQLTPEWYNMRVWLHLQQIQIFQTLHVLDLATDDRHQHQRWVLCLTQLYLVCFSLRANDADIG